MAPVTAALGLSCVLLLSLYISRVSCKPATETGPADNPSTVAKRYIGHPYLDFRWRMMSAMSYLNILSSHMVKCMNCNCRAIPA